MATISREAERQLGLRVRLSKHRGGGLLQDRVAGQVRRLEGDVHVADPLGSARVLTHVGERAERALETVLLGTEGAELFTELMAVSSVASMLVASGR